MMEPKGKVVHSGKGRGTWLLGHLYEYKAVAEDTDGRLTFIEMTLAPAPLIGAPPHIHRKEDEGFYVVEGNLLVRLGERTLNAAEGSFFYVPKGTVHGFSNSGKEPAKVTVVIMPAGLEKFFEEFGEPAKTMSLPPPPSGPPDMERLNRLAMKYHTELV